MFSKVSHKFQIRKGYYILGFLEFCNVRKYLTGRFFI